MGFRPADWLGHSSSFISSETNWELPCLILESLSCWNIDPHFIFIILSDGSRFISRMSSCFSIHPSFSYIGGDMQCLLNSKHGVFYGIQWVQFWSHLIRLYFPSISQAWVNVVQQTLNALQLSFSSAVESVVSLYTGRGSQVHYWLFTLKQLYLSSCNST